MLRLGEGSKRVRSDGGADGNRSATRATGAERRSCQGCCGRRGRFTDPHPFQSFIAELADVAATREAVRHRLADRHLFGHASDPTQGIAVSSKDLLRDTVPVDISFLDIVFQNVYSYFPPSVRFRGYRWYLGRLSRAYPDNPRVVLECGYSVSPRRPGGGGCAVGPLCGQPRTPQPNSFCYGRNTETQQARGILEQFLRTTAEPQVTAGFFVFEYYDEWWKSAGPVTVHDDDSVEEWFGLKAVEGTANRPVVSNRLAFRTVGRMFDSTWCPEALLCRNTAGGVEISLTPADQFDSITLRRNGGLLARLGPGDFPFVDDPPDGTHVYTARIEDALVKCQELQCQTDVVQTPIFRRGDIDGDGGIVITDGVVLLNILFRGRNLPVCPDAADTDDNGLVNITDSIAVFNYLFLGSAVPPPPPGPRVCGLDPTEDALAECNYDPQTCQ